MPELTPTLAIMLDLNNYYALDTNMNVVSVSSIQYSSYFVKQIVEASGTTTKTTNFNYSGIYITGFNQTVT